MIFLVKHGIDDYRMHKADGTEIAKWAERPAESEMASALSNPWELATDGYNFRDLTVKDETIPWDT